MFFATKARARPVQRHSFLGNN